MGTEADKNLDNLTEPQATEGRVLPAVSPETIEGDQILPPRCSNVLENRMQCPRYAQLTTHDDPDGTKGLCGVCYVFKNMPAGYNRQIGRS